MWCFLGDLGRARWGIDLACVLHTSPIWRWTSFLQTERRAGERLGVAGQVDRGAEEVIREQDGHRIAGNSTGGEMQP
jgi:hypothetical protein